MSPYVWHVKEHSLLKGHECRVEVKMGMLSPVTLTSQMDDIFSTGTNKQTNKKTKANKRTNKQKTKANKRTNKQKKKLRFDYKPNENKTQA